MTIPMVPAGGVGQVAVAGGEGEAERGGAGGSGRGKREGRERGWGRWQLPGERGGLGGGGAERTCRRCSCQSEEVGAS